MKLNTLFEHDFRFFLQPHCKRHAGNAFRRPKNEKKKKYNAPHRSFHLLFTQTTRILRRRTSDRKRRRESTLLSNLGPSQVKPHRHRYTRKRQTTQQRSRPLHSHTIDHLRREQGKPGTRERSEESVGCNG